MDAKQAELMRSLTAAQAALWDVIDNPDFRSTNLMLAVIAARITRLSAEITGISYGEN